MPEPTLAFTSDIVSRLTGLSESQLRRLDIDDVYRPSLAQENRRRPYSRIYSFTDIVALRVIATLRTKGISRQEIRRAATLLKELRGASWAGTRFFVLGAHLYLAHDEMLVATRPFGQQAIAEVLDLSEIETDMRRQVDKLKQRYADQIGKTIVNRFVIGGEPVFAGTRIPVATIQSLVDQGLSDRAILYDFPRLKLGDIARLRTRTDSRRESLRPAG